MLSYGTVYCYNLIGDSMKSWIKKYGCLLLTFFVLSGIMFFYIGKKQGFHEDEIFSYGSSNYKYDNVYRSYGYAQANMDYFWQVVWTGSLTQRIGHSFNYWFHQENYQESFDTTLKEEVPTWKEKTDALDYLTISKVEDIFSFFSIWLNQTLDVHPPMFYNLVHIYSTLFYQHFSKYIIFYLNLTFFLLTLVGICKIMAILDREKYKLPVLILYGASMGAISTVMFQRMYMMMTAFGVWYLYYVLKYLKTKDWHRKDSFLFGFIIFLGFLTQYYFCIYVVLTFLVTSIILFQKKDYKKWCKLLEIHVSAALIGILLFPSSIEDIFFSYRGIGGSTERTKTTLQMLLYFLKSFSTAFSIPILFMILLGLFFLGLFINKRKHITYDFYILFIPIPLFLIIVSKISPFLGENYTSRYIMMLYPIVAIFLGYVIGFISKKHTEKIVLIFVLILSIYGLLEFTPTYLYQDYGKALELAEEKKDDYFIYIFDNYFTHLSSLPEFTIYQKHLILNYNDYDFSNLKRDTELNNQEEVIVCIKNWLDTEQLIQEVLNNTEFNQVEIILDLHSDVESTYYKLRKEEG